MLEKAAQKKSVVKNFMKLENFQNASKSRFFENEGQHEEEFQQQDFGGDGNDDFEALYGVENEYTRELREKIEKSKLQKGRGLLLSFYEFN